MRALSIRQPYAELILRGIKKVEYRNWQTRIIGEQFYIYAAMKPGELAGFEKLNCQPGDLPTGVIVGTAKISHCTGDRGQCEWHLIEVKRLAKPIKPRKQAQPSWFNPF